MSSTNSEDDGIRRLMSAVDGDAALPDAAFLAGLRERAEAEFAAQRRPLSPRAESRGAGVSSALDETVLGGTVRRGPALGESGRRSRRQHGWMTAIAGSALVAVVWFFGIGSQREATLGDILSSVGASSVRMRIEASGRSREVVAATGGRVRWDEADGTYVIGREGRLWHVDETANRAESRESSLVTNGRLDVVAMLLDQASDFKSHISNLKSEISNQPIGESVSVWRASWRERPTWMTARASEVVSRNGREFRIYRTAFDADRPSMRIEAVADASDQRLQSLRLTEERDGRDELLAAMTVLAWDAPVEAHRFVVRDSLTEDGRIGKVIRPQGIVSLQPVVAVAANIAQVARRWTPVCEETLLRSGDWLRTDSLGANAVAVKLVPDTQVILGPGSLAEFVSPTEMRLHSGEAEITVPEGRMMRLSGDSPNNPKRERGRALPKTDTPVDSRTDIRADSATSEASPLADASGYMLPHGTHVFRVDSQRQPGALAKLKHQSAWLLGFKGVMPQESLGSLVANIDGRNVPLSVGYHKVTVDIRDQIARTVIEESFVNHSGTRTEGTFIFPLPADASISGFGMWIGNELVEADIVEKQRAREIFETILREKRDPGLLEWAGGNLFKARVFPIEAHSEKRVKITYTQVLPGRGRKFRYSYALQSELLKQHPLRELSIDVTVSSAVPLRSVKSPTHLTRDELTRRAGRVRFAAQNHTPTRDFEVVIETEQPPSDVVLIPHRRGDDGYFVMQFTPPGSDGDWDRELLPSGEPLALLILADTSGSMDDGLRRTQAEFVAALLASLSPRDSFNLATCDVSCDWAFDAPRAVSMDDVAAARSFLAKRRSLGWTDLRKGVESACRMGTLARPELVGEGEKGGKVERERGRKTHVIYLGDGIVTTGAKTPEEFANALPRIAQKGMDNGFRLSANGHRPDALSFHSVAVGSTFEWPVLKALGAIGGGSVRRLSSEQTPIKAARELLIEIASPGLRDVKVEFAGLSTAAVYPETLPNLPLGMQQVVVGRYLPGAERSLTRSVSEGERSTKQPSSSPMVSSPSLTLRVSEANSQPNVIVIGTLNGKPVRLTAAVQLADDESGNSFIPRLWARQHLDHLLEQGQSEAVKNDVIAMSEEFHIITPYTSLLVLESDADRERFGVKRRFQMRDGEKFFAAGRDNANYELVQKQMQAAQLWRQRLRDQALLQLSSMGREVPLARNRDQRLKGVIVMTDGASRTQYRTNWLRFGHHQWLSRDSSVTNGGITHEVLDPTSWSFGKQSGVQRLSLGGDLNGGTELLYDVDAESRFGEFIDGRSREFTRNRWSDMDFGLNGLTPFGSDELGLEIRQTQVFDDFHMFSKEPEVTRLQTESWDASDFIRPSLYSPQPMFDRTGPELILNEELSQSVMGIPVTPYYSTMEDQYYETMVGNADRYGYDSGIDGLALGLVDFDTDAIDASYVDSVVTGPFSFGRRYRGSRRMPRPPSGLAIFGVFPNLPPAPLSTDDVKTRADVAKAWDAGRSKLRPMPRRWSDEAWQLAESVLRTKSLLAHDGAIELKRVAEQYDVRWQEWTQRTERTAIVSPRGWLVRSHGDDAATTVSWCAAERGEANLAFELGRSRRTNVVERSLPPLGLEDYSLGTTDQPGLAESFAGQFASVSELGADRKVLTLRASRDAVAETRVIVDSRRRVILAIENRQKDRVTSKTVFGEFVEVAGSWWATRIEYFNEAGRLVLLTTQTVKTLAADEADERIARELAVRDRCLMLASPLPSVGEAMWLVKGRGADRSVAEVVRLRERSRDDANLEKDVGEQSSELSRVRLHRDPLAARLVLAAHFASLQRWELAWEHFDAAEKLAGGRGGFRWVRDVLLYVSRRHEELLQRMIDESKTVAERESRERLAYVGGDLELLAEHVLSGHGVVDADERLEMVDRLKAIFERQEPRRQGLKTWRQHRLNALAATGQSETATELRQVMVETYPHDLSLQMGFAQELLNVGDRAGAAAWLRKLIRPEAGWTEDEIWQIQFRLAQWMQAEERFAELVRWLSEALDKYPNGLGYRMLLDTLRRLERLERVDELVLSWLSDGVQAVKQTEPVSFGVNARLHTALKFIVDGYGWTNEGIVPKFRQPLFDAVTVFLRQEDRLEMANSILGLEPFRKSRQGRLTLEELVPYVRENVGRLASGHTLSLMSWVKSLGETHKIDRIKELREPVRAELRKRWQAAADPENKDVVANHLLSFLGGYSTADMVRQFRRELLRTAHEDYHEKYAAELFNDLLGTTDVKLIGTAKLNSRVEAELFAVLLVLGPKPVGQVFNLPERVDDKLAEQVENLLHERQLLARIDGWQRLKSTLEQRRLEAILKRLMPDANKLKPEEQAAKRAEAQRRTRTELLDRLTGFTKRTNGLLAEWLRYEQLLLLVDLNRDMPSVLEECWKSVAMDVAEVVRLRERGDRTLTSSATETNVATTLRMRHLGLLSGLVVRKEVAPAQADRLVAWLEQRVAAESAAESWKSRLQTLLLALDRPKDLERHLTAWVKQADDPQAGRVQFHWHVSLGYLRAELGRLKEAISLFEQVEKENLLPAAEYRALAMWYQAVDRRADHERSLVQAFQTADENWLSQQLQRMVNPWHSGRLPSEVDPNMMRMFQALFAKSASPQNYLWQLQHLYQASHDFRLLSMLPDSVIGHTAATAYPLLGSMSGVLSEIRDEATADELLERLREVRENSQRTGGVSPLVEEVTGDRTPTDQSPVGADPTRGLTPPVRQAGRRRATVVDQRALDFLELQVERRAAELLNQPGPHINRALAALRRAFDRGDWSPSEPRHYADMLGGLGRISQKALADEQLRQLRALFDRAARGSFDRLQIGQRLAERLWDYEPPLAATEVLLGVLDEHLSSRGGMLSNRASGAFGLAVSYLRQQGQFIAAERLVQRQLGRNKVEGLKLFFLRQWLEVQQHAFRERGETSLGQGLEHYERFQRRLVELAETKDANQQVAAFGFLSSLYQTAWMFAEKDKAFDRVRTDLDDFATKRLGELMARPAGHFQNTVSLFAGTIRTVRGSREAIGFVLDWIDHEPAWLKQQGQSGLWEYFRSTLAHWRREAELAGRLGDVEPRLLEQVLSSLRNELLGHNAQHHDFYRFGSDNFWKERAGDFERVARQVAIENMGDVAVINFTAVYLADSLGRRPAAIDVLKLALVAKMLDEELRSRLARYLADERRFAEAIPLLQGLVKGLPDNIEYRTRLMLAYFHTQQPEKVRDLLKQSDAHFHKLKQWGEGTSRALAEACLGCELFAESVTYWKETITAHEQSQSQPRRGIGNGTLSYYYAQLAQAYAGLKDSPRAVDAAVSAIVSWGPRQEERKQALIALHNVMRQSPDLEVVAKHYDAEAAKSKLENPIVRKALGQVFLELKRPAAAIPQLRLALELQPNDLETHDALIASLDGVEDKAAAVQQVLESAKLNRREIARFRDAGQRLSLLEQADPSLARRASEAERAFTSIVEALPLEAESHSMLADIREDQDRWADAIAHWRLAAEYRSLEPEPLLRLAAALIHEKRMDDAEPILRKLETTAWDQRFDDVLKRVRELRH